MPTNTSVLNILSPNLPPGLAAPTPPIGFETRLDFNSSCPLNPVQVLLCAVEMISFLANLPWNYILHNSMSMAGADLSTEVYLDRWPVDSGESKFQVQYAVLGLYLAGLAIAQGSQYSQLNVSMYMSGLKVGWLEFRPDRKPLQGSSGSDHPTPLNSLDANTSTTMLTADSGFIIDPEAQKFVIHYWMDGVRLKSQDIFTVILDCFAISAPYENEDLDAYIPAARSASGDLVFSTWTLGAKGNPHLSWGRLKRTLIIIWDMLIIGPKKMRKTKFEGLRFELKYDKQPIAGGRLIKLDSGQSSKSLRLEK